MEIKIKKTVDASKFDTIREKWLAKVVEAKDDSKAINNLYFEMEDSEARAYRKLREDLTSRLYAEPLSRGISWVWREYPDSAPKDCARIKRHFDRIDRITAEIAFLAFANGMTTNMCAWDDYLRIFMLCKCPGECDLVIDELLKAKTFEVFLCKIDELNYRFDHLFEKQELEAKIDRFATVVASVRDLKKELPGRSAREIVEHAVEIGLEKEEMLDFCDAIEVCVEGGEV